MKSKRSTLRSGYETSQFAILAKVTVEHKFGCNHGQEIVTTCAAFWTCVSRGMALMRDYESDKQISPSSLVCKKTSSHLHALRVGFLFNCIDLGNNLMQNFST